jgi:hypothetical protein
MGSRVRFSNHRQRCGKIITARHLEKRDWREPDTGYAQRRAITANLLMDPHLFFGLENCSWTAAERD